MEQNSGNTSEEVSPPQHIVLGLPGIHNVRNALAAIAVADELGVALDAVGAALESCEGIDRRFQNLGDVRTRNGTITVIDDYGHHPTEVAATLAAAKSGYPERRVVLVFQPHRFTRTRDLMDDFAMVLSEADVLVVAIDDDASVRKLKGPGRPVIPARELVPGEIVVLTGGDRVPPDLRLVREQLFGAHFSTLDARAQLAFLHGVPDRREVVDVLDADRDTHQVLGDTGGRQLLGGQLAVGRRCRVTGQ